MSSITILKTLQHSSGLFSAAAKNVTTGYNKAWIRDNIYAALGLEAARDIPALVKTYHALLDLLKKHEYKIDWMIKQPHPKHSWRYIHARYDPNTYDEFLENWGNKQNDAIGALLFKLGDFIHKGLPIIRDKQDRILIQKLVHYLGTIEYWQDPDNGMWEEQEQIHASSIGACLAGLIAVQDIVHVPEHLITLGRKALDALLPKESATKTTDLALLSLLYPYNILTPQQQKTILHNVETHLVRDKGVIRYNGDKYYSNKMGEATWTLGFPWLAIIYKQLGNTQKYNYYLKKTQESANQQGELPELYYARSAQHNENTPLAWAMGLWAVAEA